MRDVEAIANMIRDADLTYSEVMYLIAELVKRTGEGYGDEK